MIPKDECIDKYGIYFETGQKFDVRTWIPSDWFDTSRIEAKSEC